MLMSVFNVTVQMIKVASKATRIIRVHAPDAESARKLAVGVAKAAPVVLKAVATMVRATK
jgi:hypothetical protein